MNAENKYNYNKSHADGIACINSLMELINDHGLEHDGSAIKSVLRRHIVSIRIIKDYLEGLRMNATPEGDIASDIIDKFDLDKY